ncbi:carboxymuconolactone decarboxylase family protein [Prauserella muralis]|uniref:Carboxymuconolactone decarboxylase-like domain-containing protein n=1 Tax=Prauserella muralis TaxID=588067 RepID=A0A2V4ATW0_9PSEU|nr:carboxymuconolactone decarboxylase family protein [Prauserella muralis]PXY24682.1 hypothetical protein BAY60_19430 [Prauserella muralis]TWE27626.1 alkylhydroperoxidase/carboxymuconolactone decarboxylase family protein YurZ [Prauserella muralis]
MKEEPRSGAALIDQLVSERGDIFREFELLAFERPRTLQFMHQCAGYVHHYAGQTADDQVLSPQFRELIATAQLVARRDHNFAPNHVRRLYRMGVTDCVIIEAAEAVAPVEGWSTIGGVCRAIETANDSSYPAGEMPEGGRPRDLVPFAEMGLPDLGRDHRADGTALLGTWSKVAELDAELARRFETFVAHCLFWSDEERVLPSTARQLIAIAALCARGLAELARQHMRLALDAGADERQILEAVSAVLPMTGSATMVVAIEALRSR